MSDLKQTVCDRLIGILSSGKYSDTEFVLQNGDKIKGHKMIFAMASPVFEAMLYGDLAENVNPIEIHDVDADAFKTMTQFMYSDNSNINSTSHAINVWKAADKYDLPDLVNLSEKYITSNVNSGTALEILEFAKFFNKTDIEENCVEIIQEDTTAVLKSDYSTKCNINSLETVIEKAKDVPEVKLFEFIEKWARSYAEINVVPLSAVRSLLNNAVAKIRFLLMRLNEFVSLPYISELLTMEEKHSLLLNINKQSNLPLPENFSNSTESRSTVDFKCYTDRAVTKWTKRKISKLLINKRYYSPLFSLNGNPFRISICHLDLPGTNCLNVGVIYDISVRPHGIIWRLNTTIGLRILNRNGAPFTKSSPVLFSANSSTVTWKCMLWDDFLTKGFVEDDSVSIEVVVTSVALS